MREKNEKLYTLDNAETGYMKTMWKRHHTGKIITIVLMRSKRVTFVT